MGPTKGQFKDHHFNIQMLRDMGKLFCITLRDYASNETKVREAIQELELKFPPQKAEEGLSSQFKQIDQNNGFGGMNQGFGNNGFNGRGMDDDDNKKSKNKKKGAAGGKGPMISGQGIGSGKDADMFKNQIKNKGVGKVAGSGGSQNFDAPSTSSK